MATRTYRATIDGGPRNPLPVEVRGYWEQEFHAEEVIVTIGDRPYDLIDSLAPAVIEHINRQITDDGR